MRFVRVVCAIILLLAVAYIIVSARNVKEKPAAEGKTLAIGETVVYITVADTEQERSQGLSGKRSLRADEGMLFIFDKAGVYPFWMKDMQFDLDFVYINNNSVVDLIEAVPAPKNNNGNVEIINASVPFEWVLEVPAGWVMKNRIKVGDKVTPPFPSAG